MGHLFTINESLELKNTPEAERSKVFENFCKAVDTARKDRDIFYATEDIYYHTYSYGTFFTNLLYADWPTISKNQHLKGISSTVINLYHATAASIPNLVHIIESNERFNQQFEGMHIGNFGFEMQHAPQPFIFDDPSWHIWKQIWLRNHQDEIAWNKVPDSFLPNMHVANILLKEEVIRHGKEPELKKHNNNWNVTFYEEVMKKKGHETEAYTIELGKRIAEANYYQFDDELSKREQKASGSLRNIYRLRSRNGDNQYLSLDHKHGMFEYHSRNGEHLGEYRFDGTYNSEAQASHNLKTLN